jgi:ABC transport system ATP-binding/permease protein
VHLPGGIDEYLTKAAAIVPDLGEATPTSTKSAGLSAADLRAARKDLSRLERQLAKLDERERKINEGLAGHGRDYDKIIELDAQLKAVQGERAQVEEAWLELAERVPDS